MKKLFSWVAILLIIIFFALVGFAFYSPRLFIPSAENAFYALTNRHMAIKGGASLKLLPDLAISFKNVVVSDTADDNRPYLRSEKMIVPVTLSGLFTQEMNFDHITLVNPSFDFVIPKRGDLPNAALAQEDEVIQNSNTSNQPGNDLSLKIEGGTLHYIDERIDQSLTIQDITTKLVIKNGDELESSGSIIFGGQTAHLDSHVTSLKRINRDGSPVDITLKSPTMAVSFSGRLATHTMLGLAGTLQASSSDFKSFVRWMDIPLRNASGLQDFSLIAAVDLMGKAVKFKEANLVLDDMAASGDLGLDLSGDRPRLDAVLKTNLFTLDPYVTGIKLRTDALSGYSLTSQDWSPTSFDFSALQTINANISMSTHKFKWGSHEITPLDFSLVLENGHLMLTALSIPIYGGNMATTIDLDTAPTKPVLDLNVTGANVMTQGILADLAQVSWAQGPANFRLVMNANGTSPQEMISTIKGKFMVAVGQGAFIGLDVPLLMARLRESATTGWADSAGKVSAFDSVVANFDLRDGIATTNDLSITAPDYRITGKGGIDLLRQAIDMHFTPLLLVPGQTPAGLSLQVAVFGRWQDPKLFPDTPETLVNPAPNATPAVAPPPGLASPPAMAAPGKGGM